MRHLRVPSEETQQWLEFCRKKRWIMPSAGVLSFDNGMKGNIFTSQFSWYLKKSLPSFLGGFKNEIREIK